MANSKTVTTDASTKPYCKCTICRKTFDDIDALEIHINKIHEKQKPSPVRISLTKKSACQLVDENPKELRKHEEILGSRQPISQDINHVEYDANYSKHQNSESQSGEENGQKHQCDVCNKKFVHKTNLETHINVDHKNTQDFKCDQCPSQFGSKVLLNRHIQRVHFSGKYKCDICNKEMTFKSQVSQH